MFDKWQWTYKREHQSMTMACRLLCAEKIMDDQGKSLVFTLWCVVCRQYETRICGPKNFFRARTNSSSNHKTSNISDHANSEPHKLKRPWCTCVLSHVIVYTVHYYCTMKCVRSTFCNGRSSYSVVWQSSGCYEIVIFIPDYALSLPWDSHWVEVDGIDSNECYVHHGNPECTVIVGLSVVMLSDPIRMQTNRIWVT